MRAPSHYPLGSHALSSLVKGGGSPCFKIFLKYKSIFHRRGKKAKVFCWIPLSLGQASPGPGSAEHTFPADRVFSQVYFSRMLAPQITAGKNKGFDGNDGERATAAGMAGWGAGCPSTCMGIAPKSPPNQAGGGRSIPTEVPAGIWGWESLPLLSQGEKKPQKNPNNQEIEKERTLRLIHPRKKPFL